MPFKKGVAKKGGRKKGTANKKTTELRSRAELVLSIIDENHLRSDIKRLSPSQRMNLYLGCMEFVAPKLRRVDGNINTNLSFKDKKIKFE